MVNSFKKPWTDVFDKMKTSATIPRLMNFCKSVPDQKWNSKQDTIDILQSAAFLSNLMYHSLDVYKITFEIRISGSASNPKYNFGPPIKNYP